MVEKYVTVGLPMDLAKLIDKIVKNSRLGYKSRGEFVKEAVRKSLERFMDTKVISKYDDLIQVSMSKPR